MNIQDYEFKAKLQGKSITDIPEDLFIPPDALTIILEEFEGPLDLLLYLIKKQNIDIVDIPIFPITEQYIEYINMMEKMQFELASDYLVMASTLTEIKSRMLIPTDDEDEEEDDPRADLIKRLLEYQKYKNLSEEIDEIPRVNRDTYIVSGIMTHFKHTQKMPTIGYRKTILSETIRYSWLLIGGGAPPPHTPHFQSAATAASKIGKIPISRRPQ